MHADPQRVERDAELGRERAALVAAVAVGALVGQDAAAIELRQLVEAPAQPRERIVGIVRPGGRRGRGQGGQRDRVRAAGMARRVADRRRDLAQRTADVVPPAGQRAGDTVERLVGEGLGIG